MVESENPKETLRDHLRKRDILGSATFKQTHMYASFQGVQRVFKKFFNIKELPFVHNNELKILQRQKLQPSYPYAYMSVNAIGLPEGGLNGATLGRHGTGMSLSQANATLTKHYMFPISVQLEFHYITDNTLDALLFMNKALLLMNTKKLSFRLTVNGVSGVVGIICDNTEIQLPRADKDNEVDPEGHDIALNYRIATWTGVSREVAKVNNAGIIDFGAVVVNANGDVVDEEDTTIQTADKA